MLLFASVEDLNDENIQSYLIVDQVDPSRPSSV